MIKDKHNYSCSIGILETIKLRANKISSGLFKKCVYKSYIFDTYA